MGGFKWPCETWKAHRINPFPPKGLLADAKVPTPLATDAQERGAPVGNLQSLLDFEREAKLTMEREEGLDV